jgi:hypothetical protein
MHRDHAAVEAASHALVEAIAIVAKGSEFSGDIKGLECARGPEKAPFLLAYRGCILYPVGCLAFERPRP